MNIVIDARMLGWSGIGRYTGNLLSQLQLIDQVNRYSVLLQAGDFKIWQPAAPNFHKVLAEAEPYSLAAQRHLPGLIRKLHPDLVHFTHFTVAHAHLGMYAFVTLTFFGGIYFVMPRVVEREWPYPRLIAAHFWLVVIGMLVYIVALSIGGWRQGH